MKRAVCLIQSIIFEVEDRLPLRACATIAMGAAKAAALEFVPWMRKR